MGINDFHHVEASFAENFKSKTIRPVDQFQTNC